MKRVKFFWSRILGYPRRFLACDRGVAFIEFAICLPLLILLFLGGVEVARYLFIVKKLQSVVNAETNILTSINPVRDTVTKAGMEAIVNTTFANMVYPYDAATKGTLIISDIYADPDYPGAPGTPVVKWRYCGGGLYYDSAHSKYTNGHSKFGTVGGPANLTSLRVTDGTGAATPFQLSSGDEVIIAEVFYDFHPMITGPFTSGYVWNKTLYFTSLSVPRFNHLTELVGKTFNGNCN